MDISNLYCFKLVFITLQLISTLDAKPSAVQMPAGCEGKNYCTEISADYPQKEFEIILSDMSIVAVNDTETDLELRFADGDSVCKPNRTWAQIYEIVDEHGDVRFVAQSDNKFIQKYLIIECVNPGRVEQENPVFTQDQLDSFNVTCVETTVAHKFLVLTHDRRSVEVVTPKTGIPMGCNCRYDMI